MGRNIELKCKVCNKTFLVYPCEAKVGRKHCSKECHNKSMKTGKYIFCSNCGKKRWASNGEIKEWNNHFCSNKCKFEYQKGKKRPDVSEAIRGKNNPSWKGGGGQERRTWNEIKRRIRKKGNGGSHTLSEWQDVKKKYNYTCLCCGKQEPEITLTVDHVIPVSKGGTNNIDNIQPLCRSCNPRKSNKIIDYREVQFATY
jgi:5-methylcytosine-specific restriction endonuclease McrA